ncbi:MAG: SEC-C domain-containing protein [Chloroflexi bacterium]|nr:SEC-C domain-containing protein [Chloroflexota bacterium]
MEVRGASSPIETEAIRKVMATRTNWYSDHPAACTCAFCNEKRTMQPDQGKIGRNAKCPCNSGKKYKRCHGK